MPRARPVFPATWPGWPDGKRFVVCLTHDVEGERGYRQTEALLEVDRSAGFRSSFNFVPEGDYAVEGETTRALAESGFEVGVHDLHHDGKLYSSHEKFALNAAKINRYLAEWNAVGFRSGFMLRRLDWLHHLNIEYDASTFDVDPFEPQPDGVGSLLPIWMADSRARGGGYVELPYTLPQDSTMFLILRETTIDLWKRKLDWIAEHGGLALLITHPDYMNFSRRPPFRKI